MKNIPAALMNDSIHIRPAVRQDRGAVRRIESACFGFARVLFGLWPRTGGQHEMSWLAEVDRKPAGYVIAYNKLLGDTLVSYVGGIGVLPQYRGMNVGTRLMLTVLSDQNSVWLHVRPNNTAAIGLYWKLGMRELCRVSRFYANGDDAIVMATSDLASNPVAKPDESLIYAP